MAEFIYTKVVAGDFELRVAEPRAGDAMRVNCPVPIRAGACRTAFVVPKGCVKYTEHPNGFKSVPIVPGLSSEEFGPRIPGDYVMTAMEDSTFICITPARAGAAFQRRDVLLAAGDKFTVEPGDTAVFTKGEFEYGGQLLSAPRTLVAKIASIVVTAVADTHAFVVRLK